MMEARSVQMAVMRADMTIIAVWRVARVIVPLLAIVILTALLCRKLFGGD